MYEKSCEMIYKMIAARVKYRKGVLHLTNENIFSDDVNIVSAIANNRRHHKKNPYLIPGGSRLDYSTGERKSIIRVICDNLSFESPIELILGTKEELDSYVGCLFMHILHEACSDSDSDTKEMLNVLFCDYIPYAVASFFAKANDHIALIPEPMQTYLYSIDDLYLEREYAIARLFAIHKEEFVNGINDVFKKQENTTRLNKRLAKYVSKELVPSMFQKRKPYLLSANATSMLNKTLDIIKEEVDHDLLISTVYTDNYHYEDTELIKISDDFAKANILYVDSLAEIQKKYEKIPDLDVFVNKWKPDMCLNL